MLTSVDGGVSWSSPVPIAVTDAVGAFPVVRPTGELVVVFNWGGRRIGSSVSRDGALSFSPAVEVAEIQMRSGRPLRFFPLPSADVDSSGRVWVTWHDCRFDPGCDLNSVIVATSADGASWAAPRAITSGRNAFIPAIGIHPRTGRVAVAYYVVRADGGIDAELVESAGRADRFGAPRRLSAQTMRVPWIPNTVSGRMLADYISVHYAANRPLVAWVLASEPVGSRFRQAVYATLG
jgi:hypothetical protein